MDTTWVILSGLPETHGLDPPVCECPPKPLKGTKPIGSDPDPAEHQLPTRYQGQGCDGQPHAESHPRYTRHICSEEQGRHESLKGVVGEGHPTSGDEYPKNPVPQTMLEEKGGAGNVSQGHGQRRYLMDRKELEHGIRVCTQSHIRQVRSLAHMVRDDG